MYRAQVGNCKVVDSRFDFSTGNKTVAFLEKALNAFTHGNTISQYHSSSAQLGKFFEIQIMAFVEL